MAGADQLGSQATLLLAFSFHAANNLQPTAIMLSSLSQFLPAALQLHQEPKELPPSPVPEVPVAPEETDAQTQVDNIPGAKKKVKKEKIGNEVYCSIFLSFETSC